MVDNVLQSQETVENLLCIQTLSMILGPVEMTTGSETEQHYYERTSISAWKKAQNENGTSPITWSRITGFEDATEPYCAALSGIGGNIIRAALLNDGSLETNGFIGFLLDLQAEFPSAVPSENSFKGKADNANNVNSGEMSPARGAKKRWLLPQSSPTSH